MPSSNPPVDFQELAQGARGQSGSDYPYAIKATDLMKNFVYSLLILEDGLYDETTGAQGHRQRRLKIPSPPVAGTHVLGSVGGNIQWIATEDCD
jgi:hypothetical protein